MTAPTTPTTAPRPTMDAETFVRSLHAAGWSDGRHLSSHDRINEKIEKFTAELTRLSRPAAFPVEVIEAAKRLEYFASSWLDNTDPEECDEVDLKHWRDAKLVADVILARSGSGAGDEGGQSTDPKFVRQSKRKVPSFLRPDPMDAIQTEVERKLAELKANQLPLTDEDRQEAIDKILAHIRAIPGIPAEPGKQ